MAEILEFTLDKFTFRVPSDRLYTSDGVWAMEDNGQIRVGLSDFLQQRSGDVAFVDMQRVGDVIRRGDELVSIETIKVNVGLSSPVTGTIVDTNPNLQDTPEVINTDPYRDGWLALIEASDWDGDRAALLSPAAYFDIMKAQAEAEAKEL